MESTLKNRLSESPKCHPIPKLPHNKLISQIQFVTMICKLLKNLSTTKPKSLKSSEPLVYNKKLSLKLLTKQSKITIRKNLKKK